MPNPPYFLASNTLVLGLGRTLLEEGLRHERIRKLTGALRGTVLAAGHVVLLSLRYYLRVAGTLTVGPGGDFSTIQAAIDASKRWRHYSDPSGYVPGKSGNRDLVFWGKGLSFRAQRLIQRELMRGARLVIECAGTSRAWGISDLQKLGVLGRLCFRQWYGGLWGAVLSIGCSPSS